MRERGPTHLGELLADDGFGDPTGIGRLNGVLDDWCARVCRGPPAIERSILLTEPAEVARADAYLASGITHIIGASGPDDLEPVRRLVAWRDARTSGDTSAA